eukprot:TRINITY_DN9404_c0_g2_i2.p2 TRINITY_DN9404_c0_g2~~TRINITY_DN9404_c0_g2_i2.p2  ORF type:complete len:171 (+),score=19.85 TRINITY_DN9404_c0_g2_i2:50-562(+)
MDFLKSFSLTQLGLAMTPLAGGMLSAFNTRAEVKGVWYKSLNRPWFQPPRAAFPIAWTSIYITMGYASLKIYDRIGLKPALPWYLYGSLLFLNFTWSPIFFKNHLIGLGLANCIVQWFVGFACIREFSQIDESASYALLPMQLWLTVATAINYHVWQHNPRHDGAGPFAK